MPLKGIYIEDDHKNVITVRELFRQEGLEVEELSELPANIEDIYQLIVMQKADFLLIDHQLNKKVAYNGYEALQEIRKHDSTMYAVLLTTFKVEDFKDEFGIYDMEVNKDELSDDNRLFEIAEKIKRACARQVDSEMLAYVEQQQKAQEERLEVLREIYKKVTEAP